MLAYQVAAFPPQRRGAIAAVPCLAYDGLLRDKTRPSRIPPLGSDIAKRVEMFTQADPPAEATH
jgi:hypothetical protein